jgi:hypothetical protein
MGFLPDEPKHELTTERVPGGRRAALIVGVAAVLVVGTLVWKPWDNSSPVASPNPSFPLVAVAPTPAPTTSPTTTRNPPLTPTSPPVSRSADFGPQPQTIDAPNGLGSVVLYANSSGTGGPGAWCIYRSGGQIARPSLSIVVVEPPLIQPGGTLGDGQLKSVSWHVDLQTNTQDKIFYAEWQDSGQSKATTIDLARGGLGFYMPISVAVKDTSPITVYRSSIVVDWLDRHGQVLAEQNLPTTTYGTLGATSSDLGAGGCAAVI